MCPERLFDQLTQYMADQNVNLLDPRCVRCRHACTFVNRVAQLSAIGPCQAKGEEPARSCDLSSAYDVRGVSASTDRHGHVAMIAESFDLARKHIREAEVVPDRSERGSVGCEGKYWQGAPLPLEAANQFGGDVLSVRRTTAVPEEEDLPARANRSDHPAGEGCYLLYESRRVEHLLLSDDRSFNSGPH